MPRDDYRICKACDRPSSECGPLSHTRLCADCGLIRQTEALFQISEGRGPFAERRARRQLMAAHRALLAMQDKNA